MNTRIRALTFLVTVLLLSGCQTVSSPPQPATGQELREHLLGTRWQWDGTAGEIITFKEDGFIECKEWTRRGLFTSWVVIDRRTVLLTIERGRDNDRYAVLTFNDDMSAFNGFDFHRAGKLATSRRLP
jgi:hypothetical protein